MVPRCLSVSVDWYVTNSDVGIVVASYSSPHFEPGISCHSTVCRVSLLQRTEQGPIPTPGTTYFILLLLFFSSLFLLYLFLFNRTCHGQGSTASLTIKTIFFLHFYTPPFVPPLRTFRAMDGLYWTVFGNCCICN